MIRKFFVTGIAGRLGRALVREAPNQDVQLVGLDQHPWPDDKPLPDCVTTHVGSFEDRDLLTKLLDGCDGIIHTAGPNGDHVAKLGIEDFVRVNVASLAGLLNLALEMKVKSVAVSSTMEVLIGRDWLRNGMTVLDENSTPRADSPYALSRRTAETLVTEFHQMTGLSCCSLRYMAFGYGKDEDLGAHMLARTVAAADIARVNFLAAGNPNLQGDVFNIGPDTPITNADIVEAQSDPEAVVERYWPGAVAVVKQHNGRLRKESFWPVTRIRKAQTLLGWQPKITFETWLRDRGWQQQ